jgi:hypothetical protein
MCHSRTNDRSGLDLDKADYSSITQNDYKKTHKKSATISDLPFSEAATA